MIEDSTAAVAVTVSEETTGTNTLDVAPISELKHKMKPRGKPFAKGEDSRRKGKGDGDGESDGDGDGSGPGPFDVFTRQGAAAADKVLAGMMQQQQKAVEQAVEQIEAAQQTKVVIKTKGAATITSTLGGKVHRCFTEVMETIKAGLKNILLVGPAGSGKTTLARQVTQALNLPVGSHPLAQAIAAKTGGVPFASQSCSGGVTESVFTGRLLPTGEHGRFEYHPTPFVVLFEQGGGYLKDEVDAADPNVLLISNSAIDNGHLDLPNRTIDPVAIRHDNFYLLLAANTFGMGANRQYVGRNQLDAAYLDRFVGAVIEMPYDRDLELQIVRQYLAEADAAVWAEKAWGIRDRIEATGLRRIWGTRALKHGARLIASGKSPTATLHRLTAGWTADERQKAGIRL